MVKLPQPSTREGDAVRGPVSYYDPDEVEPMVTAAVMYYQAHRSQAQIARHLGVSRPTVSRLLARARQLGIVRIEIVPPTADPGLGKDLQERLGLRGIHIAAGLADPDDPAPVLAGRLNDALAGIGLQPGDVLVVGWGRAIYSLGRYELAPLPGVVVVPALGGGAEDRPWFQANEITRRWAVTLHGTPRYLHAPAFVSSALKRSLDHEEGVHSTLDLWDRAKVALVGIGAYPKPDSSLVAVGFSDGDPAIADATGDVVGRFFTDAGTLIHYPDEPRLLGITPDRMRRIPHVVGISVGADKARAIVGAARARLVNTLVTDAGTAREVAALLDA
jgi:DNA-binding transcriptional regulator LsrR (DeoR family)